MMFLMWINKMCFQTTYFPINWIFAPKMNEIDMQTITPTNDLFCNFDSLLFFHFNNIWNLATKLVTFSSFFARKNDFILMFIFGAKIQVCMFWKWGFFNVKWKKFNQFGTLVFISRISLKRLFAIIFSSTWKPIFFASTKVCDAKWEEKLRVEPFCTLGQNSVFCQLIVKSRNDFFRIFVKILDFLHEYSN